MKKRALVLCFLLMLCCAGSLAAQQSNPSQPLGAPKRSLEVLSGLPFAAGKPSASAVAEIGYRLTSSSGYVKYCDWSPDGAYIAYEDNYDIFIMNADGGEAMNLTANVEGLCYLPVFTHDGSGISFTNSNETTGTYSVEYVDLNGTIRITLANDAVTSAWSDDGNLFAYRDATTSELMIYDATTETTKIVQPGDFGYGSSSFTPDNQYIITSQYVGEERQLLKVPVGGGAPEPLTKSSGDHRWPDISLSGDKMIYTRVITDTDEVESYSLWGIDLESGEEISLFPDVSADNSMGRFSSDGSQFCYILADNVGLQDVFITEVPSVGDDEADASLSVLAPTDGETLQGGSQVNIYWIASNVTDINLQYAEFDESGSLKGRWILIKANIPAAQEEFIWNVPSLDFPYAKIRISSGLSDGDVIRDVTDGLFSISSAIVEEPHLRVIAPNGGENWQAGDSKTITWESRNVNSITIQYTFDGSSYHNVAENVDASTGSYDWTVPGTIGQSCRVLIYDSSNNEVTSTSYANFTISEAVEEAHLRIISPNGGETLKAGEPFIITWEARNVSSVSLMYSTDNGSNWSPIADSVNALDMDYEWLVSSSPSTECRVRIVNEADMTVYSDSYATFFIEDVGVEQSVTLTAPNGGESFTSGSALEIYWESTGLTELDIEISYDDGDNWTEIIYGVDASWGYYEWIIPDGVNSNQCMIFIGDAIGEVIEDESDGSFSISSTTAAPTVTVSYPNGGEEFVVGDSIEIRWNSTGFESAHIWYTTDGGTSWLDIAAEIPATDGVYTWQIPSGLVGDTIFVSVGEEGNGSLYDYSDDAFSITTPVGNLREITINNSESYHYSSDTTADVGTGDFYLNIDSATGAKFYANNSGQRGLVSLGNIGDADLTAVSIPTSGYSRQGVDVIMNHSYVSYAREGEDNSFVVFKVLTIGPGSVTIKAVYREGDGSVSPNITLSFPRGGSVISAGSTTQISWEAFGLKGVEIRLSIDNGGSWDTVGIAPALDGVFEWTVPDDIDSEQCRLQVRDSAGSNVFSETEDVFTISGTEPYIELNAPYSDASYEAGKLMGIEWYTEGVANVNILISLDSGNSWSVLYSSLSAAEGWIEWTVSGDAVSNRCIVRVVNTDNGNVYADSGRFSIVASQTIELPNIALDTDFSTVGNQNNPVDGVGANTDVGFVIYARYWSTARKYKVKLSWESSLATIDIDNSLFSANNDAFTLNNTNVNFGVLSNIYGDDWDYQLIENSPGLMILEVAPNDTLTSSRSLAPKAFLMLPVFTTSGTFGGSNQLLVKAEVTTTSAFGKDKLLPLRVFRANGASTSEPYITLIEPEGSEKIEAETQYTVSWDSFGVSEVHIEYSTDGGANWKDVITTGAELNSYRWTVPNDPSTTCRVRLTDVSEQSRRSESMEDFAIVASSGLTITGPDGNEKLAVGQDYYITWNSSNVSLIKIEININGVWQTEDSGWPASDGYYSWTVDAGMEDESAQVRLTSVSDATITSTSIPFEITSDDFINITSPAGGDQWSVNSEKEIWWEVKGVSTLSIEISYDGGDNYTKLESAWSADSSMYSWTPDTTSENCVIRLKDTSDPDVVFSVSSEFAILQPDVSITHNPTDYSQENEPITFVADMSATSEIESAVLTYQSMGDATSSKSYPMNSEDGSAFSYTLPAGYFGAPGIEYYIVATDVTGVEARSPVDVGYHSVSARVSDIKSIEIIRGGTAQNSYRMISIPLELTSNTITEQLSNALPDGDLGTDWRLFRYPAGDDSPLEYPNIEKFEPGKAFWLIANTDFTLKAADGVTVTTAESFQLDLKSGWNDIANPWMFDIQWSDIENPGNAQLSSLYTYNGSWSDPTAPPQTLEPWKGYAVRNLESSTKLIFLNPEGNAQKQAGREQATETSRESWRISIRASAAEALDNANHLGVREYASVEWDAYDHVEPPGVGNYVSVSFPHEDWVTNPYDYTVDFRPPEQSISWDFTVRTNVERETVDVEFTGIESIPDGAYLTLIDRDNNKEIDLTGAGFSFRSAADITERSYTLIVGDTSSPGQEITGILPKAYVTAGTFPNPFNPQTTLHYELSRKGAVEVRIFNTLGQQVAFFKPGVQDAGVHEVLFDARDLTSGIYVYRIDASFASTTGKMLFMK